MNYFKLLDLCMPSNSQIWLKINSSVKKILDMIIIKREIIDWETRCTKSKISLKKNETTNKTLTKAKFKRE